MYFLCLYDCFNFDYHKKNTIYLQIIRYLHIVVRLANCIMFMCPLFLRPLKYVEGCSLPFYFKIYSHYTKSARSSCIRIITSFSFSAFGFSVSEKSILSYSLLSFLSLSNLDFISSFSVLFSEFKISLK